MTQRSVCGRTLTMSWALPPPTISFNRRWTDAGLISDLWLLLTDQLLEPLFQFLCELAPDRGELAPEGRDLGLERGVAGLEVVEAGGQVVDLAAHGAEVV